VLRRERPLLAPREPQLSEEGPEQQQQLPEEPERQLVPEPEQLLWAQGQRRLGGRQRDHVSAFFVYSASVGRCNFSCVMGVKRFACETENRLFKRLK